MLNFLPFALYLCCVIDPATISLIFDTARIEEVVGDFVRLRKRGVNYMGLCPFHNEKTPSFTVSSVKGIYKCFGCGKGGNAVQFIMDHEQLSYPEALRWLAKKYNINIEEKEQTPEELKALNERESLLLVTEFARKFFSESLLNSPEGISIGLSYFKERGFSQAIIEKFQLGYSPENRTALVQEATKAGYQTEYLIKTGLCYENERGVGDRFAARVIFPIQNISGRTIAFGGRTLSSDKKIAKYVNSPESEIYSKSHVLYGLNLSKNAIVKENNCYLVEGYIDVIAMHMAELENVVASSGTSLTQEQIRLIKRYTPNITILYDGDPAGIKASFRGIDLILQEGMNVKVLLFPGGDDPDSYSRKVSTQQFQEFVRTQPKDFISFKTGLLLQEAEGDPIKKAELIKEVVVSVALIPDNITRSVYIKEAARLLQTPEELLIRETNRMRTKAGKAEETPLLPIQPYAPVQSPPEEKQTASYQEKGLIEKLIKYGNRALTVTQKDEDGNEFTITIPAAELIVTEINSLKTDFENPLYGHITRLVETELKNGRIPDEEFYIRHSDAAVSQLAATLLSEPYVLSENWENKYHILTKSEEEDLINSILKALFALKQNQLVSQKAMLQRHLAELQGHAKKMEQTLVHLDQKREQAEQKEAFEEAAEAVEQYQKTETEMKALNEEIDEGLLKIRRLEQVLRNIGYDTLGRVIIQ